jgi:hypothetical protein
MLLATLPVDGWLVLELVFLDHVGIVLVVQVDQAPGHHPHILQARPANKYYTHLIDLFLGSKVSNKK